MIIGFTDSAHKGLKSQVYIFAFRHFIKQSFHCLRFKYKTASSGKAPVLLTLQRLNNFIKDKSLFIINIQHPRHKPRCPCSAEAVRLLQNQRRSSAPCCRYCGAYSRNSAPCNYNIVKLHISPYPFRADAYDSAFIRAESKQDIFPIRTEYGVRMPRVPF